MNTEWKDKWIVALQSGTYQQGKHMLRNRDDKYCCLGVLCDVVGPASAWHRDETTNYVRFNRCVAFLPRDIKQTTDLNDINQHFLARLNDREVPFATIAVFLSDDDAFARIMEVNCHSGPTAASTQFWEWAKERELAVGKLCVYDDT